MSLTNSVSSEDRFHCVVTAHPSTTSTAADAKALAQRQVRNELLLSGAANGRFHVPPQTLRSLKAHTVVLDGVRQGAQAFDIGMTGCTPLGVILDGEAAGGVQFSVHICIQLKLSLATCCYNILT